MPSDVTGSSIYNQRDGDFEFRAGPDLHEPAPRRRDQPRAAEDAGGAARGDAGAAGDDRGRHARCSSRPFLVLATQNPIEYEGTYPLPEAQLDRFLLRIGVGYPSARTSGRCSRGRLERARPTRSSSSRSSTAPTLLAMQRGGRGRPRLGERRPLHRRLVAATRESAQRPVGASPRGSLALLKLSRGRAALAGRDFVTPDDVKAVAVPALAHRLTLRPELWVQRVRPRTSSATSSRPCRRRAGRGRRGAAPTRDAVGVAAASRLRGARGARPARARSCCAGPSWPSLAAPFPLVLAARARARAPAGARVWLELDRDRALEGDELDATVELRGGRAVDRLELCSCCPPASPSPGREPVAVRLSAGEERDARAPHPLRALGRLRLGETRLCARATGSACSLSEGTSTCAPLRVYPRPEQLQRAARGRARRRCSPATRSRARRARGSSSPTSARSRPATACAVNWRASARRGELG